MMDLRIIDYGLSNLGSVRNALDNLGYEARLAQRPEDVLAADRLILPGVGAAGEAMTRLRGLQLDQALTEAVCVRGRPLLGICLGMQLVARKLYEYGEHEGLGWIDGEVVSVREIAGEGVRVPHMGWNRVAPTGQNGNLLATLRGKQEFYFAHSYTLRVADPDIVAAHTDFGVPLVAAIRWRSVFAVQFHPEKSQLAGQRLIQAFLDWRP